MARVLCVFLLVLCVAAGVSGCRQGAAEPGAPPAPAAPPVKTAPATPLAEKKQALYGDEDTWSPSWDALIEQSLPPDLLSATAARAVRQYCPAFAEASDTDKRAFWAYTFQALAAAEAGLTPTADVHHTETAVDHTDPATHRLARQEGLLQLKYEDAQRYGCDFDYASDSRRPAKDPQKTILQPERNLSCGLKIMDNQIITQGKPLVSRTSYWSTLQPGTAGYRVFARQMANVPEACGLHTGQSGTTHAR